MGEDDEPTWIGRTRELAFEHVLADGDVASPMIHQGHDRP
jgi:hypothetical protein